MKDSRLISACVLLVFGLISACFAQEAAPDAHITIDASVVVNTFRPADVFGVNMLPYINAEDYARVQPKVQAAGTVFMRYPSGIADDVHWNGAGSFDAQGHWVPDRERYLPSFEGKQTFRGTTSHYGRPAMVTDGDPKTRWLSNVNASDTQWIYVDLDSPKSADSISILWGSPRAARFTIQYWNPKSFNQWMPYSHTTNDWVNTSAADVAGQDGEQRVQFTPVTSRYFRILLQSSTAKPAQYSIAEITLFDGKKQLTNNVGSISHPGAVEWKPDQTTTVASSAEPACTNDHIYPMDFEKFMAYVNGMSPRVSPMITINCGGATPQEAAAWVHYANKVRGYGIKYWEIGNEMNGAWETGGPLSASEYTRQYIAFYEAMKAEDPSIIIAGPGVSDAIVVSGDYDGRNYIQAFIDHLAEAGKGSYANAIDFHWYPFFQNNNEATTWATVTKLSDLPRQMNEWLKNLPNGNTVSLLCSEYNSGAGTPFSTSMDNGLWLACTLGEYIRGFGSRGMASYWTPLHPADAHSSSKGGDQSFFQYDAGPYQYQPRPVYHAMTLLSSQWAIAGDTTPHTLVEASSDNRSLRVYANRRPDNTLALLVVNRAKDKPISAQLNVKGFAPAATATQWTWSPAEYAWSATTQPYHADPDAGPTRSTKTGISASFQSTFPASSLTVLQLVSATTPAPAVRKVDKPMPQASVVKVLPWNNHKAAFSLTYDDGDSGHVIIAIPELDKRHLKGTFNITGTAANTNVDEWKKAFAEGHEVANHTMNHRQPKDLTPEQIRAEVADCDALLRNIYNRPITTFAYPFGAITPELVAELKDRYVAARGGGGRPQPADGNIDWMNIPSFVPVTATTSQDFQGWVKQTDDQGAWCVIMFHAIQGAGWGWEPIRREVYTSFLDSIAARQNEFWVATFSDVASYLRAQKTFEAAAVTTTGNTTTYTWQRPNVIPAGVNLKLKLAPGQGDVRQGDKSLTPDENGVYTVSFDAGNLAVSHR